MKKLAALLLSALMLLTLATGCGGNGGNTSTPSDSQKEEQTPSTDHAGSDLVVGFSTGAAGTTFRQEGIDDFTKVAEEYKAEGRIKDYKIVNNTTNWDANEQANIIIISRIRNKQRGIRRLSGGGYPHFKQESIC